MTQRKSTKRQLKTTGQQKPNIKRTETRKKMFEKKSGRGGERNKIIEQFQKEFEM